METLAGHGMQVKSMYEAFQSGDVSPMLSALNEDVIWEIMGQPHVLYAGIYHGPKDVKEFFKKYMSFLEVNEFAVEHIFESGTLVIATGYMKAKGRHTGKSFSTIWCMMWEFNAEGEVVHFRDCYDTLAFARGLAI